MGQHGNIHIQFIHSQSQSFYCAFMKVASICLTIVVANENRIYCKRNKAPPLIETQYQFTNIMNSSNWNHENSQTNH